MNCSVSGFRAVHKNAYLADLESLEMLTNELTLASGGVDTAANEPNADV